MNITIYKLRDCRKNGQLVYYFSACAGSSSTAFIFLYQDCLKDVNAAV